MKRTDPKRKMTTNAGKCGSTEEELLETEEKAVIEALEEYWNDPETYTFNQELERLDLDNL